MGVALLLAEVVEQHAVRNRRDALPDTKALQSPPTTPERLECLQQRQPIAKLTDSVTVAANHECLAYPGIADPSKDVREVRAVADRACRKVRAHAHVHARRAIPLRRASRQHRDAVMR